MWPWGLGQPGIVDALTNDTVFLLEIVVNGAALVPRQKLLPVPYAILTEISYRVEGEVVL